MPGTPSGGAASPLLVVLAAAILAGFWFFLARRRRRRPEPALAVASPYVRPPPPLPVAAIKPPKPDKHKKPKAPPVESLAPTFADAIPAAPSAALADTFGEASMPRWRRPSLAKARYASPRITAVAAPALTFAAGSAAGIERRLIRYDLVALTDIPDETRGAQVGQLQANDEVEILGKKGVWLNVRTPAGAEGWIHRTTLKAIEEPIAPTDADDSAYVARPVDLPPAAPTYAIQESIETDVTIGAFAAAAAAAARLHELEAAQVTAPISEPAVAPKPTKQPRARRVATPKASPRTASKATPKG